MPKKAVSITLDQSNLLWLKGRARVLAGGSLSEAVDQLIDEARAGKLGAAEESRSVAGTIEIPDEATLTAASAALRAAVTSSLDRSMLAPDARKPARATRQGHKK
jgi:hypothetical protein